MPMEKVQSVECKRIFLNIANSHELSTPSASEKQWEVVSHIFDTWYDSRSKHQDHVTNLSYSNNIEFCLQTHTLQQWHVHMRDGTSIWYPSLCKNIDSHRMEMKEFQLQREKHMLINWHEDFTMKKRSNYLILSKNMSSISSTYVNQLQVHHGIRPWGPSHIIKLCNSFTPWNVTNSSTWWSFLNIAYMKC